MRRNVYGAIYSDVAWRDGRLALQADCLAVYNPVGPSGKDDPAAEKRTYEMARGVMNEIILAAAEHKPCYVYQDPTFDPEGLLVEFIRTAGTMGPDLVQKMVKRVETVEEMFDRTARFLVQQHEAGE